MPASDAALLLASQWWKEYGSGGVLSRSFLCVSDSLMTVMLLQLLGGDRYRYHVVVLGDGHGHGHGHKAPRRSWQLRIPSASPASSRLSILPNKNTKILKHPLPRRHRRSPPFSPNSRIPTPRRVKPLMPNRMREAQGLIHVSLVFGLCTLSAYRQLCAEAVERVSRSGRERSVAYCLKERTRFVMGKIG